MQPFEQKAIRPMVFGLGLIGCFFFGLALVVSMVNPSFIEQIAKDFIQYEVERTIEKQIKIFSKDHDDHRANEIKQILKQQLFIYVSKIT